MSTHLVLMLLLLQSNTPQVELPQAAKEAVDIALTVRWTLSQDNFYKCDFNGDSLQDYSVEVTSGAGNCLVKYFVALIADSSSYGFYLLSTRPAWLNLGEEGVVLRRKGDIIPIFGDDDPTEFAEPRPEGYLLNRDAIEFIPHEGCCSAAFVFFKGRFRLITTSD